MDRDDVALAFVAHATSKLFEVEDLDHIASLGFRGEARSYPPPSRIAGIEILEARLSHLAYSPEIAAAMLQRQQAGAIIAARKLIVDGAVGMVEMAIEKLSANEIVVLDDERKATMTGNLLVVLCGQQIAQPVLNAGGLYN